MGGRDFKKGLILGRFLGLSIVFLVTGLCLADIGYTYEGGLSSTFLHTGTCRLSYQSEPSKYQILKLFRVPSIKCIYNKPLPDNLCPTFHKIFVLQGPGALGALNYSIGNQTTIAGIKWIGTGYFTRSAERQLQPMGLNSYAIESFNIANVVKANVSARAGRTDPLWKKGLIYFAQFSAAGIVTFPIYALTVYSVIQEEATAEEYGASLWEISVGALFYSIPYGVLGGTSTWGVGKLCDRQGSLWKAMLGAGIGGALCTFPWGFDGAYGEPSPDSFEGRYPAIRGINTVLRTVGFILPPLFAVIGYNLK